uniref:Major facilitator superfamily (MFS) profile domain-containing protein n=1 Tax=Anopheles farauti TaxID=69004 RepID=A0A182QI46_9DIPT
MQKAHETPGNTATEPPANKAAEATGSSIAKLTKRAAITQIVTAIVANITIISSGMGIGFPSIAMMELTNSTTSVVLSESDASWFGKAKPGVAIGLSSTPASVYAAEVAHPQLRGRLTLLTAGCTGIGMLLVYSLGYMFKEDWRYVCTICGVFTGVSLITVIPLPESPSWLVGKKRLLEAERYLKVIRAIKEDNHPEIKAEIKSLEDNLARFRSSETKKSSKIVQLKKPEVYKPLSIMCIFFLFQQFSGIFVIIVYAASFSVEAGVAIDPFLSAVLVGLTRVVTTILMSFISDKFGRRPPALFSGFGMACCMFGLAACAVFPVADTEYNWIPTVLLIAFIFTATLGFLTLPFSMNAEVYPTKIRGFASGLTIFFCYTMSFIILKSYPAMVIAIGNENVFLFFGLVSLIGIAFVYFFLPETKGRTLQDIEEYFRGSKTTSSDATKQDSKA